MALKRGNDTLHVRGNVFVGKVVSAKTPKTATIEREHVTFVRKYERYKKSKSRMKAHVPANIQINEGDIVRIGETRKISKTKSFVIMEVVAKAPQQRLIEETADAEKYGHRKQQAADEKKNEEDDQ